METPVLITTNLDRCQWPPWCSSGSNCNAGSEACSELCRPIGGLTSKTSLRQGDACAHCARWVPVAASADCLYGDEALARAECHGLMTMQLAGAPASLL